MWRALFFSVGVMLIVLGLECLVVDKYLVSQRTRVPTLIARMLEGDRSSADGNYQAQNDRSNSQSWNSDSYNGSRFQASPYSSDPQGANQSNYFGGTGNSKFSFAGFGNKDASKASDLNPKGLRVIQTKDWMPWSLLAAGTLVVLYTNSTRRVFSGD